MQNEKGTYHWIVERVSAILIFATAYWLFYLGKILLNQGWLQFLFILKNTYSIYPFTICILASIYHGMLGMQVISEDYIHTISIRQKIIFIIRLVSIITMLLFIYSIVFLLRE